MGKNIEKKIRDLKSFIKEKTDLGTANYVGKEVREICGMVESQKLNESDRLNQSEQLKNKNKYCNNKTEFNCKCRKHCGDLFGVINL